MFDQPPQSLSVPDIGFCDEEILDAVPDDKRIPKRSLKLVEQTKEKALTFELVEQDVTATVGCCLHYINM